MRHKGLYITLFVLTVLLLGFPAVQQHTRLFELKPLHGVTVVTERPRLTIKSFMEGSYQRQEDQFLTENIGFRELFVRCYNQMCWSLFRKSQNTSIFVGDDNWIFNEFMIKHHNRQFVYDYGNTNEEVVKKMKQSAYMLYQLQEVLKEYGTSLFVCLTPGKDVVMEEYIPERHDYDKPPGVLAIEYFPQIFDSLGVNYLNLSDYYLQLKGRVDYPLYLKSSFHWSTLSACYTTDTLMRYMESLSGLNLHDLSFSEPYLAPTRVPDADLEEVMNLLWPIESDQNYYTTINVDDDSTAVKPRWLVVGDSYFWEWQYNLPWDQLFYSHHYWYYNSTIYNDALHNKVDQADILSELLTSDIVMLIYSPCNLYDLNRDFLTRALLSLYFEDGVVEKQVEKIKQDIRNTPEWFADIEQKAQKKGQDLEEALTDNAKYMLYSTPWYYFDEFTGAEVAKCRNSRIAKLVSADNDPERVKYRIQIYNDPVWLETIGEKAVNAGISLEEAIERDIDWLLLQKGQ